ncbi:MAG: hypothetical protein COA63_014265 [Methylophaga sp.]|nr:hypothetical protein [Methylophaga sp.]
MGSRIIKAIGYAMPIEQVRANALDFEPGMCDWELFELIKEKVNKSRFHNDLIEFVSSGEDGYAFLFFPQDYNKKGWYRYDDDIDYEHARWAGGNKRGDEPDIDNSMIQVPYAPYPYTNKLMDLEGNPVEWTSPELLKDRDDIVPGIPEPIRQCLIELKIFNSKGVNLIRCYHTTAWS